MSNKAWLNQRRNKEKIVLFDAIFKINLKLSQKKCTIDVK